MDIKKVSIGEKFQQEEGDDFNYIGATVPLYCFNFMTSNLQTKFIQLDDPLHPIPFLICLLEN